MLFHNSFDGCVIVTGREDEEGGVSAHSLVVGRGGRNHFGALQGGALADDLEFGAGDCPKAVVELLDPFVDCPKQCLVPAYALRTSSRRRVPLGGCGGVSSKPRIHT